MYADQLYRPHQYFLISISIIISVLILSLIIQGNNAQEQDDSNKYKECSDIVVACGKPMRELQYPFWGENIRPKYCGLEGFELSCENSDLVIDIGTERKYHVVEINLTTSVLTLNPHNDILGNICASIVINDPVLDDALYDYGSNTEDLDLYYHCGAETQTTWIQSKFSCWKDKNEVYFFRKNSLVPAEEDMLDSCYQTTLPVDTTVLEEFMNKRIQPKELFNRSFKIHYNRVNGKACSDCVATDGLCWQGTYSGKNSTCLYSNGTVLSPYPQTGKSMDLGQKIGIASGVVGGSVILLLLCIFYWIRTKHGSSLLNQNVSSDPKDVEAFIKKYRSSIPRRFRYSTVKRITNSFRDELGRGGYGKVYRGSLTDGLMVAVKVLNATKGCGEEFINEVASIGRTSHVNVVTLLGFCYEGKRQALIYEFMPNGSLEKFIYGATPSTNRQHLGWEKLYNIALGISRGLEYLHGGCNTRILHFDIKPHNILLDEDFCPKISDFGLAKLYNRKESAVSSLLQARGTIGYIAPEVFSRNFGQVSHKSDVYSYGMMILEMVGGRKNVDARADHTSEIFFPRWLYKRIQSDDVLNLASEISKEENELVRKMVIVGLWCIQIYPSERPSMGKVIEMLEGQIAVLEIPPNPYLWSVPSSPSYSQTRLGVCSPLETESTSQPFPRINLNN